MFRNFSTLFLWIVFILPMPMSLANTLASSPRSCQTDSKSYECALATYDLVKRDQQLQHDFPTNAAGKALREATVLFMFRSSDTAAGQLFTAGMEAASRLPKESLAAIRFALEHLTANEMGERNFLSQFATRLEITPNEKYSLLVNELGRSKLNGISAEASLDAMRMITLERAHEFAPSSAEFEKTVSRTIDLQKSQESKGALLKHYELFDAEAAHRVALTHGITLPIRKTIQIPTTHPTESN